MRRTFTAEEKASVFELWKNGTGFSEIANILGSKPGTIFTMLRDTGGIKPHEHKRAVAHLTLSEREEIRAGLSAKMSIRAIATALNRSPSTISREVQRNRGRRYYKAVDANTPVAARIRPTPFCCLHATKILKSFSKRAKTLLSRFITYAKRTITGARQTGVKTGTIGCVWNQQFRVVIFRWARR